MTIAPQFQHILYEIRAGVARISLNTPERRNALWFGPDSNRAELIAALARAEADDNVGSILLTGEGTAFCAGGDLSKTSPRASALEERLFFAESAKFLDLVRRVSKPTIGAVHGQCLGAGLGLIAQLDIVVAAESCRFGLVEGAYGMPGATEVVPLVGPSWAKFLIFTGETIDADLAARLGLILATIPDADMALAAFDLAVRIATAPRAGTRLNKLSINSIVDAFGLEGALEAGRAGDSITAAMTGPATAPDGRLLRDIVQQGGVAALRRAVGQAPWWRSWEKPAAGPEAQS